MEATAQPTAFAVQNDTRPVLIVIVSIMLILVSLIGISLRIYSRLAILGKLFADDGTNMSLPSLTYLVAYRYLYLFMSDAMRWSSDANHPSHAVLMLMGTITAIGLSASYIVGAHHGFGKHVAQITPHEVQLLRKITFACIFLYIMAQLLVKTAVLVLYYRLDQRTLMRTTVYILIFIVATQNITFFTMQSLSCISIGAATLNHCLTLGQLQLLFNVTGVIIIAIDIAIFVIPLWMLHNLELPAKQKLAGGTVFALAFLPIAGTLPLLPTRLE